MASTLEAIIFTNPGPALPEPGVPVIPLPGGLSLVPVTREPWPGLDPAPAAGDDPIPAGWALRPPVAAFARMLSAGRSALYVFGETFGGTGTQEAMAWTDGTLVFGPCGTCDLAADLEPGYQVAARRDRAINQGLRVLGVRAADGPDEFETAGLTRHRRTEDWLSSRR